MTRRRERREPRERRETEVRKGVHEGEVSCGRNLRRKDGEKRADWN